MRAGVSFNVGLIVVIVVRVALGLVRNVAAPPLRHDNMIEIYMRFGLEVSAKQRTQGGECFCLVRFSS